MKKSLLTLAVLAGTLACTTSANAYGNDFFAGRTSLFESSLSYSASSGTEKEVKADFKILDVKFAKKFLLGDLSSSVKFFASPYLTAGYFSGNYNYYNFTAKEQNLSYSVGFDLGLNFAVSPNTSLYAAVDASYGNLLSFGGKVGVAYRLETDDYFFFDVAAKRSSYSYSYSFGFVSGELSGSVNGFTVSVGYAF